MPFCLENQDVQLLVTIEGDKPRKTEISWSLQREREVFAYLKGSRHLKDKEISSIKIGDRDIAEGTNLQSLKDCLEWLKTDEKFADKYEARKARTPVLRVTVTTVKTSDAAKPEQAPVKSEDATRLNGELESCVNSRQYQ